MRDTNENMIELIDVSKFDNVYASIIRHKIANKELKLRFGIDSIDYGYLKRILEFRPFDNTGVAPISIFLCFVIQKRQRQ
ncbi:hypothetical protein QE390_002975 [Siphonobacter sp. SORGH_AS 1065]|nr:hypothetical protein [Siphonobacter sp. SORGH_AS_1065]